jgi:hypothetical protein
VAATSGRRDLAPRPSSSSFFKYCHYPNTNWIVRQLKQPISVKTLPVVLSTNNVNFSNAGLAYLSGSIRDDTLTPGSGGDYLFCEGDTGNSHTRALGTKP